MKRLSILTGLVLLVAIGCSSPDVLLTPAPSPLPFTPSPVAFAPTLEPGAPTPTFTPQPTWPAFITGSAGVVVNAGTPTPASLEMGTPVATVELFCGCNSDLFICSDFDSQAQAQFCFEKCGGASNDIHNLDWDEDGWACFVDGRIVGIGE